MSLRLPISQRDHIDGNMDAEIVLLEYGDYQCPFCGAAYYEVKRIQEELADNLKFVFRNFPLSNMHEFAMSAAIASEVAGDLGKFWEMHDLLYENQKFLDYPDLVDYAQQVGLDVKEFELKFKESKFKKKIEQDIESGLRSGVNGTPSFYINGEKYDGAYSAKAMLEYIESLSE